MKNVSSEQELKELLEDGKITEDEYQQLLEAMEPKHHNGNQAKRPKISRKNAMIAAILFTILTAGLLWVCLISINNEALRNKPIVIGLNVVCVIGNGIITLHYWIAYWTFEKEHL